MLVELGADIRVPVVILLALIELRLTLGQRIGLTAFAFCSTWNSTLGQFASLLPLRIEPFAHLAGQPYHLAHLVARECRLLIRGEPCGGRFIEDVDEPVEAAYQIGLGQRLDEVRKHGSGIGLRIRLRHAIKDVRSQLG